LPNLESVRFQLGRFRPSFLPALLTVALAVTGVVTFHAYKASKEHREALESVLSAYMSFAAQRVQEATQQGIQSCAEWLLVPAIKKPELKLDNVLRDGCLVASGGIAFELDLTGRKVTTPAGLNTDLARWLLDTLPRHPTFEGEGERAIGSILRATRRPEIVFYILETRDSVPVRAMGIVSHEAFNYIAAGAPNSVRLPPGLVPGDTLLKYFSVEYPVTEPQRAQPRKAGLFTAITATADDFGALPIVVGLREAGLNVLAPGGLPRTRGLEFMALFALAAGLVASSLLLLRREAQLARTRANFVSGVSHELRTPLAQIRMFAEMLLLGRVRNEADRRRSLEIIDTEARRLSHLVENVLQVARSEHGHTRVNPTVMSVAPVVRECVETFSVLAQARGIDFRMELQEDLIAPVDSAALRQIVLNLLDNAAKYGPDGQRIVVGVALYDETARLWVDDEGQGIPARDRERVFDPFYRARDAQHTTGSGIGLSVVRELVVLHGGSAWIEDAPDAGTRVVVQFPGAYVAAQQQTAGEFAVA
jgi:signal transduction histidine kinase